MPENHEKSEVISDGPTDIVNYRVACTRLKRQTSSKLKVYDSKRGRTNSFTVQVVKEWNGLRDGATKNKRKQLQECV